ncbi:MAG: glycosyl transferase family 2 [Firmicutes bacterium HGW-Firmicutes-5]|nr:MAG: glycosyl transferase family 2 [Firmicutes bacterium HGW-Firmicutes-5]
MNDIVVSIVCITYNQEKYISEAIESFLMQKTNFNYEILIHDDASKDKTPEIIKKYETQYPNIIRPVYQKENQYSKGVQVLDFYQDMAKGKYIAICEGDDYWTDSDKLQKQVDYMEKHQDCSACVHAAIKVDAKTNKKVGEVRPSETSKDYTTEMIIMGGGGLFATNSILYRRKFSKRPDFYLNCYIGDFPLIIYFSICGRIHYMETSMSAYRINVENSWSVIISKSCTDTRKLHTDRIERMLNEVDDYTNKKYTEVINKKIEKNRFDLHVLCGDYKDVKSDKFKDLYKALSFKIKLYLFLRQYSPKTIKLIKLIKRKNG